MFFPVILGTARKGRFSEKVAKYMVKQTKKAGYKTQLIDVRDYRIPATDDTGKSKEAKKLRRIVEKADGLVIVSPEYNHSYPGELKMMLDMLYQEYKNKPVGICGVSRGSFSGARMIGMLHNFCLCVGMVPIQSSLYFGGVRDLFEESGKIKDEKYHARVERFLKELEQIAGKLKG
jgi:NAD(P)H-dependent FMN reductase